jgi:serine O-acetyltransferase
MHIWQTIQEEALRLKQAEPLIQHIIEKHIEGSESLWAALASILAGKMKDEYLEEVPLKQLLLENITAHTNVQEKIVADMKAYFERDYACNSLLEVLLLYRGFQAITAYRVAHVLYLNQQKLTARLLQNRIFDVYAIDIHPNAKIGAGMAIDHGIGVVIGETAEIGDNVFMLHNVTLGSTGLHGGDRHPKIRSNVFIGAGATIIGNIIVHEGSNIAAGSVVTKEVPPSTTVAGVPAKVIGPAKQVL